MSIVRDRLRRDSMRRLAALAVLLSAGACNDSTGPKATPVPAAMLIVSGESQSGAVGTELVNPLVVRVVDADGVPVAGQIVNFRVTAGGGSVFAGAAITNADGKAQERWTLGTTSSAAQTVEARAVDAASGAALVFATFHATATAGAPASLRMPNGNVGAGPVGSSYRDSLLLVVWDQYQNPVPGVTVNWSIPAGAGTLTNAVSTTSATGSASTKWTYPSTPGQYTVSATVGTLPAAQFNATVSVGAPATVVVDTAAASSAPVASVLRPVFRLVDAYGNTTKVNSSIAFAVTAGNGSVTSSAVTDNLGRAHVDWTLGTTAGANQIRATFGASSVLLDATGTAGTPAKIVKLAGDAQTAAPGTAVAVAPSVRVTDAYDNLNIGTSVSFTVTGGGGTVTGSPATTNASGVATLGSWTLGSVAGSNSLVAAAGTAAVTFTASSGSSSGVVATVPGTTIDYRAGRILYRRTSDGALVIRSVSGADEVANVPAGNYQLTPTGVIGLSNIDPGTSHTLYEWRNGVLTSVPSAHHLDVNANYAAFDAYPGSGMGATLYRRDLTTDTDVVILGGEAAQPDVPASSASNGDVAFVYTNIYRWRNGTFTLSSNGLSFDPISDGVNVVYRRSSLIAIWTGSETVLASGTGVSTTRYLNYNANGGWTAFTKPSGSVLQLWLRSPAGVLRQQSNATVSCQIDAIGDDGTVVFTSGTQRYIVTATGSPSAAGLSQGTVIWREGSFYLLDGGSVSRITP